MASPRVALYHRVSTVDQNASTARRELRRAAKRHGFKVVLDVEETGSGANNNRPGLLEVLDAGRRGDVDVVMVWKLDRFGRSALDLLAQLRELDGAGVRFVAVTQGLDIRPGGDPMSRLMLTMLSAVAEFERDLIIDRTKLGLERARAEGKRLGRPPAELPPTADVVRLRSAGRSWAEVAKTLDTTVWRARKAAEKGGGCGPPKRAARPG